MAKSDMSTITLTVRKLSTGYKIFTLLCDDMTHAHNVAKLIMKGDTYGRCYVVATDWQQEVLFTVQPQGREQVPPTHQLPHHIQTVQATPAPVNHRPALQPMNQHDAYGPNPYAQSFPVMRALPQASAVIDAEIVEEPRFTGTSNIIPFRR